MSADAHADAFKQLLAAATKVPAYDLDELARLTAKPADYVEVYLSPRAAGEYRFDGSRDSRDFGRLSTRVVAATVTNGRLIEDRIWDLFEHSTVVLGGGAVVQVDYESGGGDFAFDEGAFVSQLTDWTFVLP